MLTLQQLFNQFVKTPLDASVATLAAVPRPSLGTMALWLLSRPTMESFPRQKAHRIRAQIKSRSVSYPVLLDLHLAYTRTFSKTPSPQVAPTTIPVTMPIDPTYFTAFVQTIQDQIASSPNYPIAPQHERRYIAFSQANKTALGLLPHTRPQDCYYCNFGPLVAICTDCLNNLVYIENPHNIPRWHKSLDLNRSSLCRMAKRNDWDKINKHITKRSLKQSQTRPPRVVPQAPKDFDLSHIDSLDIEDLFPKELTRDQRRIQAYNALKNVTDFGQVFTYLKNVAQITPPTPYNSQEEDEAAALCDSILKVLPPLKQSGGGFISQAGKFLTTIINFMKESKILVPIIILIIDIACIALLAMLLKTKPKHFLMKILKWFVVINLITSALWMTGTVVFTSFEVVNKIISMHSPANDTPIPTETFTDQAPIPVNIKDCSVEGLLDMRDTWKTEHDLLSRAPVDESTADLLMRVRRRIKLARWLADIEAELKLRHIPPPNISSTGVKTPKEFPLLIDSDSDEEGPPTDQSVLYDAMVDDLEPPRKQGFEDFTLRIQTILSEGLNSIAEGATAIVEETAKITVKDAKNALHTIATTVRDGKTLFDVFIPLVQWTVATVYETVTGKPYITQKDKIYHDKLTPIFQEMTELEDTPGFKSLIVSSTAFRHRVEDVVTRYTTLRDEFFKCAPERMNAIFLSRLPTINMWKILCYEARATGNTRVPPIFTEICGHPSTGKSTFVQFVLPSLFAALQAKGYPNLPPAFSPGLVFDRKVENEYFDGENEQMFWTMDDIFQSLNPDVRFTQTMEVIQVCNSAPYQLHMSSIPDKMNHFCRCLFLYATRNGDRIPTMLNISEPSAYYRRRDFLIELHNDPAFAGLKPADPNYSKYWILKLHDGFGNFFRDITVPEYIGMVVESAFKNLEIATAVPTILQPSVNPDLFQTFNTQAHSSLLASRAAGGPKQAQPPPLNPKSEAFVPKEKPTKPTRPCKWCRDPVNLHWDSACPTIKGQVKPRPKKQGSSQSRDSPRVVFDDLSSDFDFESRERAYIHITPPSNHSLWERVLAYIDVPSIEARLKERRQNLFDSWTEYQTITSKALALLAEEASTVFTSVKNWTVNTWNSFMSLIRITPWIARGIVASIPEIWNDVVSYAKTSLIEHLSNHKWKYIFGAIGVVVSLSAVGAAVAYFNTPDKPSPPIPQSRDDMEKNEERSFKKKLLKQEESAADAHDRRIDAIIRRDRIRDPHWQSDAPVVPPQDLPIKQMKSADIPKLILFTKNLYYVSTCDSDGGNAHNGQLLFLAGRIAITAAHVATVIQENRARAGHIQIIRKVGGLEHEQKFMCSELQFSHINNCELVAIKFPNKCQQHVDITSHLIHEEDVSKSNQHSDISVFSRLPNGDVKIVEVGMISLDYFNPYSVLHPEDPSYLYWSSTKGGTLDGDSGGLWFSSNPKLQHSIVGLHSGGNARIAFGALTLFENLHFLTKDQPGLHDLPDVTAAGYDPISIAPNYVPHLVVKQGASMPRKNCITPSVLSPHLYELGWKTHTLPSSIRPIVPYQVDQNWKGRGVVYDGSFENNNVKIAPLDNVATKLIYHAPLFPKTFLNVFDNLHMFWPIPKSGVYTIYHEDEIIYGHPSLDVDPIRKNTSPGYPFTVIPGLSTRKMIFGNKKEDKHPKFTERLSYIFDENEKEGGQYHPIYTLSLKVERLPVQKVMDAMSRSIFGGPVDYQVYGQMLYYDLLAAFASQPSHQWTIGMNPHSTDWTCLYRRLSRHPHWLETDAKRWDNSQEFVIPEFIIEQIIRYLANLKINNRSKRFDGPKIYTHLRKAGYGAIQAFVLVVNTLYLTPQQVKSGNFWTTLFNCLINELRWKIVLAVAVAEQQLHVVDVLRYYQTHVEGAFHGDDSLITVSDEIFTFFHIESAKYYWKKLFNIELTPPGAQKTDTTVKKEVSKTTACLIKRSFVYEGGHVYAPLEWNVITDMCLWVTDPAENPKISSHNVASALMEAAHHPRAQFDALERDLKKAVTAAGVPWRAHSYEQYRNMFKGSMPYSTDVTNYVAELRWT